MRNRLTTLLLLMPAFSCVTKEYVLHERMAASRVELSEARPAGITTTVPAGFDYQSLVEEAPRFGVSALEIRCLPRDSALLAGRLSRIRPDVPWAIFSCPDTADPEVTVFQKGLSWRPSVSVDYSGDTCTISLSAGIENLTGRSWLFEELVLLDSEGRRAASTGAGSLPPGRRSYSFWAGTGRMLDCVLAYDALEPGKWSIARPAVFHGVALPHLLEAGFGPVLAVSGDTLWLDTDDLEFLEVSRMAGRDRYEYTLTVVSRCSIPVTLLIPSTMQLQSGAVLEVTSPAGGSAHILPSGTLSITATHTYPRARSYYP